MYKMCGDYNTAKIKSSFFSFFTFNIKSIDARKERILDIEQMNTNDNGGSDSF